MCSSRQPHAPPSLLEKGLINEIGTGWQCWKDPLYDARVTRQVSSMIHSARPTVSPVVSIVFAWNLFCFARFWKVGTNVRTICAKTMITTGSDCGPAEWINCYKFLKTLSWMSRNCNIICLLKKFFQRMWWNIITRQESTYNNVKNAIFQVVWLLKVGWDEMKKKAK